MPKENRRVFWVVTDSLGVGAMPDAAQFKQTQGNDVGANTLWHIIEKTGGLQAPHLQKLGLANVLVSAKHPQGNPLWSAVENPLASFGRMAEVSAGKDTSSGHWELAGCAVPYQMPVFYEGLPQEMLERFLVRTKEKGIPLPGILGEGKPASGTEILEKLGEEHVKTGKPIIYTSIDSVFQIAAHENTFGLEKLYQISQIARDMLNEYENKICRVIARPFVGDKAENFQRTANRHDYSLEPIGKTILDAAKEEGYEVISMGKIADIFAHRGFTRKEISKSNEQGMDLITALARQKNWQGIAFVNLVDFDMLYGHRRNALGYRQALEALDKKVPAFLQELDENDLLLVVADHGCDPTFAGTDHTREYVPVLLYQKNHKARNLGTRKTFADVAATIAQFLDLSYLTAGESLFVNRR